MAASMWDKHQFQCYFQKVKTPLFVILINPISLLYVDVNVNFWSRYLVRCTESPGRVFFLWSLALGMHSFPWFVFYILLRKHLRLCGSIHPWGSWRRTSLLWLLSPKGWTVLPAAPLHVEGHSLWWKWLTLSKEVCEINVCCSYGSWWTR